MARHDGYRRCRVAGCIASETQARVRLLVLPGNALWAIWGWHDHAYALIALQIALAALKRPGSLQE
jgi:hypothetical protein